MKASVVCVLLLAVVAAAEMNKFLEPEQRPMERLPTEPPANMAHHDAPAAKPAAPANLAHTEAKAESHARVESKAAAQSHAQSHAQTEAKRLEMMREKLGAVCLGCMNNIEQKVNTLSKEGHDLNDKKDLSKAAQDMEKVSSLMSCLNSNNFPNCLPKKETSLLETDASAESDMEWFLYSIPYPITYSYVNPWWYGTCNSVFSYYGWGTYLW
eukprot:GILK01000075.1.p1 GENE.GILK01000075.1~~GILK01000075.1.p1  ORF type:complete len:229 (+),score=35.98 GILK01000075.1:54-689(+)